MSLRGTKQEIITRSLLWSARSRNALFQNNRNTVTAGQYSDKMYFDKLFFIFNKYIDKVFEEIKFACFKKPMESERVRKMRAELESDNHSKRWQIWGVQRQFADTVRQIETVHGPEVTRQVTRLAQQYPFTETDFGVYDVGGTGE